MEKIEGRPVIRNVFIWGSRTQGRCKTTEDTNKLLKGQIDAQLYGEGNKLN